MTDLSITTNNEAGDDTSPDGMREACMIEAAFDAGLYEAVVA